jgi:hypothetical protein
MNVGWGVRSPGMMQHFSIKSALSGGHAVPLPHQDGSGLEAVTVVALCREFVAAARHAGPPCLAQPVRSPWQTRLMANIMPADAALQ